LAKQFAQPARSASPAVILQDLVMPEVDRLALVRSFRAHPKLKDIPLIVLSSKEEAVTKAEAFALGVYISFRIFDFPDITAEGSVTLGAAFAAVLLVKNWPPLLATPLAFFAGALAGCVTAILAVKFNINQLLSGIMTMTALYSVNLRIMGRSNIPLMNERTLVSEVEALSQKVLAYPPSHSCAGR
jgi:ABC-type uncharacterized transport system permease subunit